MTTVIRGTDNSVSAPAVSGSDGDTGVYFPATNQVALATNGTQAVLIDASQNVGISATPAAWGTNKALQIERGGITSYISVQTDLFQNCYYDGSNWKYIATDEANKLTMYNGQFIMYSAPSGTAGNNITFTEVFQVNKDKTIALQGATQQTGTGITFPATQSASTNANTLDDYEEGTWTPIIRFGGATTGITYNEQIGTYVRIGRIGIISMVITLTSKGSATGDATIVTLPFSVTTDARGGQMCATYTNFTNTVYGVGFYASGTTIELIAAQNNSCVGMTNSYFQNNTAWRMTGIYIID